MHYKTMFKPYSPCDAFSVQMLSSIPKKVYALLEQCDVDLLEPGTYGPLRWHFGFEGGEIYYTLPYSNFVKIWWGGDTENIREILSSDHHLIDISKELDYFVDLEKKIYSELDQLKQETDAHRNSKKQNLSALAAEVVQQSKV